MAAMEFMDSNDDDSYMKGNKTLMAKKITAVQTLSRKCDKASPYVLKYCMTIASVIKRIGKDNLLIVEDQKQEGVFHLPLFCQNHFQSNMLKTWSTLCFDFRVFEKRNKKQRKEVIKIIEQSPCSCNELVKMNLFKDLDTHVVAGRFWRMCLESLMQLQSIEMPNVDFTDVYFTKLYWLDGTRFLEFSDEEEETKEEVKEEERREPVVDEIHSMSDTDSDPACS